MRLARHIADASHSKLHAGNTFERLDDRFGINRGHNPQPVSDRTATGTVAVIEMFVRLGLALSISLGLALLLAWGWDSSDPPRSDAPRVVEASAGPALR